MPAGPGENVLLVGMPLRHLVDARQVCRAHGQVTLPAGGAGDLDDAPQGCIVYLMASDAGADEVPAATWAAILIGRRHSDPDPEGLPASWVEERRTRVIAPRDEVPVSPFGDDDDEGDVEETHGTVQVYLDVRDLRPLDKQEWLFTNELVRKQERGGRTFFPRTPRLIRAPD